MDEISKKDLLAETGISYGQLYRWKREGLIPEEWFVKRASFTGQETFFPRERTLSRVRSIMTMRDEYSLEEIRNRLNSEEIALPAREVMKSAVGANDEFITGLSSLDEQSDLPSDKLAAICAVFKGGQDAGLNADEHLRLTNDAIVKSLDCNDRIEEALVFISGSKCHFIYICAKGDALCDSELVIKGRVQISDFAEELRSANIAHSIRK